MKQDRNVRRYAPKLADLRPYAANWDGPYFRPFSCGINDYGHTPPAQALFMDAMEPMGCWEYVLTGSIYYKVGSERYRADAGQAIVSRRPDPGWMLRPVKDSRVQAIWIAVTGDQALQVFDYLHTKYGQIQPIPIESQAIRLLRRLVSLAHAEPTRSAHFWSEHTFRWMSAWWQAAEAASRPLKRQVVLASHPSRLIGYGPRTFKRFASEMGYSVAHLSRKLSKQWHQSPGRVLRGVRLDDAAKLLRTTRLDINEIATRVGFYSPSAFSRSFTSRFRQSPRDYRAAHQ